MDATPYDLMGLVYRSLVVDSLLPSDPLRIGEAALAAMARRAGRPTEPLPAGFGVDVEGDARWLTERLPAPGPWWDVFHAMAWRSDRAHTGVLHETSLRAMSRLLSGDPEVHHGFAAWRQPDGRLAVADVASGGSAHACGLRAGDVLVAVDGVPARRANSQLLPLYAGLAGTVHELAIERAGVAMRLRLALTRGRVDGVCARELDGAVGYLQVRWFSHSEDPARDTAALVGRAGDALRAAGAKGLVIDLRSGIGGHPAAVVGIASLLSAAGEIFVERDDAAERVWMRADATPTWLGRPLAVLVNEQTISCGEYLALALAELEGAVLVGMPTAGGLNGIRRIDLGDGWGLAIPERTILGPRRRVPLPGCRLEPDVSVPNPSPAELEVGIDEPLEAARRIVVRNAR
jgi:C-terminal processing protease CtpA/Prc